MRKLLWPLVGFAALYRMMPAVLKRTMAPPRRPQPHTPSDLGLPEIPVALTSVTGKRLHAWLIPVSKNAPAVVVVHGWGGNSSLMLPLARHLHEGGLHALFLDARNHGLSEPDDFSSMPRFAEDVEVAIDWLLDRPEVTSIGLLGHSVGGGAALLVGARNEIPRAIVAASTFADPAELMASAPPLSRVPRPVRSGILKTVERTIGYRFEEIAPVSSIIRVSVPVLLVHGDADRVVDIENLYRLATANPGVQTLVIPGADHGSLEAFEPYAWRIVDFLKSNLS